MMTADAADAERLVLSFKSPLINALLEKGPSFVGTPPRLAILTCGHPDSPLKPAELQVLRAQYEKEGEYVGVQTKFNYAWVRYISLQHPMGLLTPSFNYPLVGA